jgi:hypothetical protein
VARSDSERAGGSARSEYARIRAAREARQRARYGRFAGIAGRLGGDDSAERNWRRGAEGEERTARRLESLTSGAGVTLLHDRRLPGSRANIDHVAIGPSGVTVIDSKRYKGKVTVRGGRLMVAGRDRTKLIRGVLKQMEVVRAAVGEPDIDVRGAICWLEVDGLPFLRPPELEGVRVVGPRTLARQLRRSGRLDPARIAEVADRIAAAFPSAG